MKAVVFNGPRDVSGNDVPDAKIEKPADVLVRVTRANICGSDLHMYEGRTEAREAYEHFDAHEGGWTKIVLKPAA